MNTRAQLLEVISDIFDFSRHRTGKAIALFAASALALGVLVNALFGVAAALSQCLLYPLGWTASTDPRTAFRVSVEQCVIPVLIAFFMFILDFSNYRSKKRPIIVELEPPEALEGLILMLSTYSDRRGACPYATADAAVRALTSDSTELVRNRLILSNWGPAIAAIEHHAPKLRHCWILCTEGTTGSKVQFDAAREIFSHLAPEAAFHRVLIPEAHDISSVVPIVEWIYRPGENHGLDSDQIIADFTGGTAAMSAGMILATLNEDRLVEYLRQDRPLDLAGRALTREEIRQKKALAMITTTRALAGPVT